MYRELESMLFPVLMRFSLGPSFGPGRPGIGPVPVQFLDHSEVSHLKNFDHFGECHLKYLD